MHHLVYISAAAHGFRDSDLSSILASAREHNAEGEISGMLMFHSMQFFQVLEGPEAEVRACFDRIKNDPRHSGVIVLLDQPAEKRCFEGWDMASVEMTDLEYSLRSEVINILKLRDHAKFEELHRDKAIGIFADTYLADLNRFAAKIYI